MAIPYSQLLKQIAPGFKKMFGEDLMTEIPKANFTAEEAKSACIDTLLAGNKIWVCLLKEHIGVYVETAIIDRLNIQYPYLMRRIVWRGFHHGIHDDEPLWIEVSKENAFFHINDKENV